MTYTSENGIPLAKDYPYTGRDNQCKTFTSAFKNTGGFMATPKNSPAEMKKAVTQ